MLEQLLETLPAEIRVWLKERKPTTSAKAGEIAEDYLQARRPARPTACRPEIPRNVEKRSGGGQRCHTCGELGHFARDCKKEAKGKGTGVPRSDRDGVNKSAERVDGIRCYNCGRRGHVAMNCPSNAALYCGQYKKPEVVRCGTVEGHPVKGIVLDTGCTRTLVRKDLVPQGQETGGEVSIRCAHGDVVTYQLAEVELEVGGKYILVEAGVAPNLPAPVLLGTDVPDLAELLQSDDRQTTERALHGHRKGERRGKRRYRQLGSCGQLQDPVQWRTALEALRALDRTWPEGTQLQLSNGRGSQK